MSLIVAALPVIALIVLALLCSGQDWGRSSTFDDADEDDMA